MFVANMFMVHYAEDFTFYPFPWNSYLFPVLVCLGCCNKLQQTGWLEESTFLSHSSPSGGVQEQGARRFSFGEVCLLACTSPPPRCDLPRGSGVREGQAFVSLFTEALISSLRALSKT